MYAYFIYFTFTLPYIIFGCQNYHDPACQDVNPIEGDHFMNQFIAEIEGGEEIAKQVARDIGFEYKKPMKTHKDHYFFTHEDVYDRHKNRHEDILKILRAHDDVKTADQQYVWHPTITEVETYEDMVGLEEALEVKTSHFHPDEIEIEGRSAWELVQPDDIFVEPEPLQDYPPIHTIVDFEKLYAEKNREKEKRAQERRLQEALEKKLEEEPEIATTSVTLDSETDPQKEKSEIFETPDEEKILGNEKIDENGKAENVFQDEKIQEDEKSESIGDEKVLENEKIDEEEKLESADNGEVLKDEKIGEELESTGNGKVLETQEIDNEKGGPKIEKKVTEESGTNEARTIEADDEVTVETYEE